MTIQKTNLLVLNSIKNLSQFAVGFCLAVAIFGYAFSIQKVLLAASGLLLTYSAAYIYNDLTDFPEDSKDPLKLKFKPIARGDLSIKTAKLLMYVFLIFGLAFSFLASRQFLFIIILMLAINFLYTSPRTRFRNSAVGFPVSIFLLELLKFASGWLAYSSSLNAFPFAFASSMALIYVPFVHSYKKKIIGFLSFLSNYKVLFAGIAGFLLFIISLLTYGFKFQMIISAPLVCLIALTQIIYKKEEHLFERTFYAMLIAIAILFVVSAIFFSTPLGIFDAVNGNLAFMRMPQL